MAGNKDCSDKMTKVQDQLRMASSPRMHALQEQIDRITSAANTPGLRAFQEQVDRITSAAGTPGMRALQDQIDRITSAANTPGIRAFQEQVDRITSAASTPGMRALQDQIDRITSAANTPGIRAFQEQIERMVAAANDSRMTNLLAQTVASYQGLTADSVLASYLVSESDSAEPTTQTVEVEGFDSLEVGDWAELEVTGYSDIDHQIVEAIQNGKVEQLPEPATQRLQLVIARIVVAWDMLLRIFNTCMAVVYLSALMSSTTAPLDIPKQAEQLSNEQRELLADYRVVNREGARLRAEATTNSQVISSLKLGTLVEVIEYNDKGWYRVATEIDGQSVQGWMYVTITTPVPKPKYPRGHFVVAEIE
ncbi:hypothetical protein DNK06_07810 [Pseudomonas daroniae]|uniref:SH3b domain-containing protein n=2 Tax=Pseudomonadaceae TaxID=135621 RepID=A0A4Q9QMW1_9GAMM|nr:SH3 domain-containing protein [Pseudomonas daroniae]TBU81019.1 hypothetical protein DNK06_07810 [Pseudomonas daroniae]TBU87461.1 hypothetical protein DNJ99_21700 [Pseudomonas daroniae]